ncbi:MAG: DRTGG domain-containing protein, partial [Dehalococcoidales bacterium]|nr:DRTGG domain-containing protein [Dehalococcoidales bacterium]
EYKKHGSKLFGIILNKVPRRRLNQARTLAADACAKAGIRFLGILPEDRFLYAITVAELAEVLGGKILNNPEKSGELIEHLMLGAMTFDSGLDYFSLRDNKAVILREERPDMQMAALQTSTRCMVLSGGGQPMPVVAQQAVLKKIPLISTSGDVPFLVTVLEKILSQVKFNQEKKLPRLVELLKQNLDANLVSAQF